MTDLQFTTGDGDVIAPSEARQITRSQGSAHDIQHEEEMSAGDVEQDALETADDDPVDDVIGTPSNQPPLLQPAASRVISCLRAPCLKKATPSSGITSPHGTSSPSESGSHSPAFGSSPSSTAMEMSLSAICSFAAIKSVVSALPNRHVHFDEDPPEAGITHSQDNYDRRPIECTRGGSLFDLSLPPRGTCPSYSGDADDEACHDDEDDGSNSSESIRGFARWARLKNGGTIFGGATLKLAANSTTSKPASATDDAVRLDEERAANTCSLPVHGIRSFGGLAGSIGHDDEVQSLESDQTEKPRRRRLLSDDDDNVKNVSSVANTEQDDGDAEQSAFRQAVYAALSMSPNATPMPSPSLRTRWECVTSYFEQASSEAASAAAAYAEGETRREKSASTTPELNASTSRTTVATTMAQKSSSDLHSGTSSNASNTPPATVAKTTPKFPVSGQASISSGEQQPRTKLSPSPSCESSTNPSSSPMSSRCSSTDTWSSHGGGGGSGDRCSEADSFENAFAKSVALLNSNTTTAPSNAAAPVSVSPVATVVVQDAQEHDLDDPHWLAGVSSPSDAADSAEYEQGMSSSSTGGGGGAGWLSSCGTSPDTHPSDGPQSMSSVSQYVLDAPTLSVPPMLVNQKTRGFTTVGVEEVDAVTPVGKPAFLSGQRRFASLSAPASASHSPCVLSADESEEGGCPPSPSASHDKMQRSMSCARKVRKHAKRIASSGDSPADSDDGNFATSSRLRRGTGSGQRSKSMSSSIPTLKMSSFSTYSFRSEIDDEGALGGF